MARVLEALDPELLLGSSCLFGGGTAIALLHGEYRESIDLDFLVSSRAGYRSLRELEITLEGRISLEAPRKRDRICGVATLTALDLAASKLLANSDRWADDSVFSRDLIDLAMMEQPANLLARAAEKAREAYGESIERDLTKAIEGLRRRPGRLDRCLRALQITCVPKALLWKRIKALGPALAR